MNKIRIINEYGYNKFFEVQVSQCEDGKLIPGRIIEVHKEQYKIITERGENSARLKGSLFYYEESGVIYPTVGDFVLVKYNPMGEDIIYKVLDRKSKFSRIDSFYGKEQLVAANFDYVFIMASLNHDFNEGRIERYLATAWQSGAMPIVVLTKKDLCEDYEIFKERVEQIAIGVPIIAVSSYTGEGIEELWQMVKPQQTLVFLGSSGVGKSSLVNAMAGKTVMKVNEIREDDSKGRHTTTHRQLVKLENGTMIIDTPGMRELGMWNVGEGLDTAFNEIEELAKQCKFRDCSHRSEPGCAVKEAIRNGSLAPKRFENYIKLRKEISYARRKEEIKLKLQESAKKKSSSKMR